MIQETEYLVCICLLYQLRRSSRNISVKIMAQMNIFQELNLLTQYTVPQTLDYLIQYKVFHKLHQAFRLSDSDRI